jgi:predicted PurR-regulated permease PerM
MSEKADYAGMNQRQRWMGGLSAAALALAGLVVIREFLPALAWAVVIAIGVWPFYARLAKRWPKHKRELLPAAMILLILLVLVIPLLLAGLPVLKDSHEAAGWLQQARTTGLAPPPFLANLPYGPRLTQLWHDNLGKPGALSILFGRTMQGGVVRLGRHFGAEALHRLVLTGFMLLALFFLLRDAEIVTEQVRVASRRAIGPAGERVGRQMFRQVQGTVNGLVLVGLGEGLILGIAYWIAGVPHAALFGLLTGLLAMVPFGATIALGVSVLALLAAGKAVAALVVAVVGILVTFAADHFVRPVLIGGATRLPFLWVLLGILGGVETFGLVGLFVGPTILAALMLLWREYVGERPGPISQRASRVGPRKVGLDATSRII